MFRASTCNNGQLAGEGDCPVNPSLGKGQKDWGCTKDNKTGLIWELKTSDGGLRDMSKTYTNYTSDYPADYYSNESKSKYGSNFNTDGFVTLVNNQGLCGAKDWRLPTKDDLTSLLKLGVSPKIESSYFPNTKAENFWSSVSFSDDKQYSSAVGFGDGYSLEHMKREYFYARLVRGFQY